MSGWADRSVMGLGVVDVLALLVFAVCWLACEPLIRAMTRGALNPDMEAVRRAWMRAMCAREVRIVDGQLLGHAINSASFFASANLILIAAVGGALFGGEAVVSQVAGVSIAAPERVLQAKLVLITICLARGLLDFIWAIRQLNYTVALAGAAPESEVGDVERRDYADVVADVLNPAMNGFNRGVRAYYFALAAAAWLVSPLLLIAGSVGALALLAWRQGASKAARGVRQARRLLGG